MLDDYISFLSGKNKNNFWKKAKQKEYTADAVNKILYDLRDGFKDLTTRNSITLRYLGLVINLGSDRLQVSGAGQTFIDSLYKQNILDEQIMKVYLDCPMLNDNISIKVVPMEILLYILNTLEYLTFDEYQLFVCWINSKDEIPLAINLIRHYRENGEGYTEILAQKSAELQIDNFSDNVKRFFDMLMISSYITRNSDDNIVATLPREDINIFLESFSQRDFSSEGYYEYLTTNNGRQMYVSNPGYITLIESLEQKTPVEQKNIIDEITKNLKFPALSDLKPKVLDLKIDADSKQKDEPVSAKKRSQIKIDYELRDSNNRAAGDFAEKIVIKYETEELEKVLPQKVTEIKQVSKEDDGLGYDILSFSTDGTEKHIEVKAVRNKPALDFKFYISENEIETAKDDPNYHIYIVFDYLSNTPIIFKMPNPFKQETLGVSVNPVKFLVTVNTKG